MWNGQETNTTWSESTTNASVGTMDNGACYWGLNNATCDFDGGDYCGLACDVATQGDLKCDALNNNKDCGWDGGYCCNNDTTDIYWD